MNRRKFLFGVGATTTAAATMGLGARKLYGQSSPPDPNTYNAAVAAHAIASGNKFYGTVTASDWWTVNSALSSCLSEWTNNGRDAGVQAAVSQISASAITSNSLDQGSILQTMQNYQPNFQVADVQQSVGFVNSNQYLVQSVLDGLQQNGLSPYLTTLMQQAAKIAEGLQSGTMSSAALRRDVHASPMLRPPPLPPGGGSGKYNCATDGALILGAGLAFATISIMSLGTVDVLAGAAWGGIALWGGLGTTGWGVGHAVAGCGF